LRRFSVFVLGVALGAALLWGCAFVGMLGFTSVEGAAFSALVLFVVVVADVALGSILARLLLRRSGLSQWGGEVKRVGLFVGGSLFVGALASGLFLGLMIILNTPPAHRSLFAFAAGPGLGLVYGMLLGTPAVVGATLVELRLRARGGDGSNR
jgi:hypothetical protein